MMNDSHEYVVYEHITPNGKRYIGITKLAPNRRWDDGRGYNEQVFGRAIKKYGWENIIHNILETNCTRELACEWEQYYIKLYNTQDSRYGYNVSNGGETCSVSDETKAKISAANTGRKLPQVSASKMGHEVSMETRAKLSNAIKQKWADGVYPVRKQMSEETKEKLRQLNLGKTYSEECRAKKSKTLLANPPHVRSCECVETGEVFKSTIDAERHVRGTVVSSNIQACCSGRQKSAYGLHWRYYYG